jgi:DNA-directed RNA polymerase specialized sigma24 family protein
MQSTKDFRRGLDLAFVGLVSNHDGGSAVRYDRVSEALVFAQELVEKLARERDELVAEVYALVGSYQSVADALGLSRARVQQLVERGRSAAE